MKHYDYIIAGAGCAGLSLVMRMLDSGAFIEKRILLVDRAPKSENDRTWCFWEEGPGYFEELVYHRWQKLHFHSPAHSRQMDISPFTYKMIRAIDFYNHCFGKLADSGVDILYEPVESIRSSEELAYVKTRLEVYSADYVFSSVPPVGLQRQAGCHYLLQHFHGWSIRTEQDCFSADSATLMDFRLSQEHGASFMYVLPFASDRAMLEYTVFSESTLPGDAYAEAMQTYMRVRYPGVGYRIESTEQGCIPMTNHKFAAADMRIIYLGTAGGATKPSSGYTFQTIQARSEKIVEAMLSSGSPALQAKGFDRFLWYDSILLRVLSGSGAAPVEIFDRLFCRNEPSRVLRFLDNSTTLSEEIGIISTLPRIPFIKAAVQEFIHHD